MPPRVLRSAVSNGPTTDHRNPRAVAYDGVDILDRSDAVPDQAIGFAQQGTLQTVVHEPFDLLADPDRHHPRTSQDRRGALDDGRIGEGCRNKLDDPDQKRRIAGMGHEGPMAAGQMFGGLRDRNGRGGAGQDGAGRRRVVDLPEQVALEVEALGPALLDVVRALDADVEVVGHQDPRQRRLRCLVEEAVTGQVGQAPEQRVRRGAPLLRVGIAKPNPRPGAGEHHGEAEADAAGAQNGDLSCD